MSLYAQYIKERENKDIVETDEGFATYQIYGDECYIADIYVIPGARKTGLASQLANQIKGLAKSSGCKILTGSVCLDANNAVASMNVLYAYGMKVHSIKGNMIYFSVIIVTGKQIGRAHV